MVETRTVPEFSRCASCGRAVIDKLPPLQPLLELENIAEEYNRARAKFPPMHGPREGYAVILEELDEMWDAIKANNVEHARKEALQVAAMALAFLLEVK